MLVESFHMSYVTCSCFFWDDCGGRRNNDLLSALTVIFVVGVKSPPCFLPDPKAKGDFVTE